MASTYLISRQIAGSIKTEKEQHRRAIPILNLHRVSVLRPEHPMTLHPAAFRKLLEALQKNYRFISLRELDEILMRGSNSDDLVSLTFDDCYGCNYVYALPILKELGIPATFFVSTGFIDSSKPLTHDINWKIYDLPNFTSKQLEAMAAHPDYEMGSHSVTHVDFSRSGDQATVRSELRDSKLTLERITGRPVVRLAIPFGHPAHFTREVIDIAQEVGYVRAYSHFGGRNVIPGDGRVGFVLHRICNQDEPDYARACLEGYRGRSSFLPGKTDKSDWPLEFHPIQLRRL